MVPIWECYRLGSGTLIWLKKYVSTNTAWFWLTADWKNSFHASVSCWCATKIDSSFNIWQQTQLSLTNRATHLCKRNDVANLSSVIKIRLQKKIDSSHPAFQGQSRSLEPTQIDPPSRISYWCSSVTLSLWDIRLHKCCDLESWVTGPSRSLHMSQFNRAHVTSNWRSIITIIIIDSSSFNIARRFWYIQCRKMSWPWNPSQEPIKAIECGTNR